MKTALFAMFVLLVTRRLPRSQVFDTGGTFLRMFTIDLPPLPATHAVQLARPEVDPASKGLVMNIADTAGSFQSIDDVEI